MATLTSGAGFALSRERVDSVGGTLHHGSSSVAASLSSCSSSLGFGISTANGSEDHCNVALAQLFQQIMNDMKGSTVVWEDFLGKSSRLHGALRSTLVASSAFLDAFQRVADVATNARGATKEIGKCLTRMVLRQRSIEAKTKTFTSALMDCLVTPLQEKMEDWKKTCGYMDKEHAKEYKRCRTEIKKRSNDTIRLQKKAKKGTIKQGLYSGNGSSKANDAWNDLVEMKRQLQDKESEAVRQAMIEERSRFCLFVSCLKPFLDEELGMLSEMVHLEEITDLLMQHSADPFQLPAASVQALQDVKSTCSSVDLPTQDHLANDTYYSSSCSSGSNHWGNYMSPPGSPLLEEASSSSRVSSTKFPGSKDGEEGSFPGRLDSTVMGERQGSICSISNASTSSYASSDVSSSSYGGIKLDNLDKTLTAAAPNKSYRRCYSDNNGHEQHYYPSSITSSIAEHDGDSDGDDGGNNDTLLPANHKRRPRKSSLSRSEDLQGGSVNRHHPLSLAVRNEYYSTIRFSSISSGDSGFVSNLDHVNGFQPESTMGGSPDNLLTPTTQPPLSARNGFMTGWFGQQGPQSIAPHDTSDMGQSSRRGVERAHTISYNGHPAKRPPLTQETFMPPGHAFPHRDMHRTAEAGKATPSPPPPRCSDDAVIYANSMSDTASLPPPPDTWMSDQSDDGGGQFASGSGQFSGRSYSPRNDGSELHASMTIRRVKAKDCDSISVSENAQTEVVMRKHGPMSIERSHRRLSQQIYGIPGGQNRAPPPPLPIRRTPSLHQSIYDMDDQTPSSVNLAAPKRPQYTNTPNIPNTNIAQPNMPTQNKAQLSSSINHTSMINSLQERFRNGARINSVPNAPSSSQPLPAWSSNNGNNPGEVGQKLPAPIQRSFEKVPVGNPPSQQNGNDARSCVMDQIKNRTFALRKVRPEQCRDRSSPFVRK